MRALRSFLHRFRGLFRPARLEHEMNEELRGHLEELTERNVAAGMSPDEARRAAMLTFGGVAQIQERARDERRSGWGEEIVQDLRYAKRQLLKHRMFSAVTVLTLALAIGVNSATFSMVRDMILMPLVRDARQDLVSVYTRREGTSALDRDFRRFSFREFAALRADTTEASVFTDVAAMMHDEASVGNGDRLQRSLITLVSENYFALLGVRPHTGRFFSAEEARPNAAIPVVVSSHAYWQRLGAPAGFVGSQLRLNGRDYTVIGIAPAGFGGLHTTISPSVWIPLGAAVLNRNILRGKGSTDLQEPTAYRLELVAALRHGLSLETARARLGHSESSLSALAGGGPGDARRLLIAPPPRFDLGNDRPADESFLPGFAALALGMAACVLLVACLNLANLFLARGYARRREIAIRMSLGASRARVIRQLLLEALVLSLVGGVCGILLSGWVGDWLQQHQAEVFSAGKFTFTTHAAIDASSLVTVLGLCVAAVLAFSLLPAWRATQLNLAIDLKRASGSANAADAWSRFFSLGHCLVMAQIALAMMLLFGAALFTRGAWNASRMDYGFATESGVVANVDYSLGNTTAAEAPRRQQALLARARTLPGATQAALASAVPYDFADQYRRIFSADAPAGTTGRTAFMTAVSEDYFRTLGIALLRGREFTAEEATSERAPRVAVIDERLSTALFDGQDALGRRIAFRAGAPAGGASPDTTMEIVGIVRSPRNHVFEDQAPLRVYQPLAQAPSANIFLHVAAPSPDAASTLLPTLRRELQALDSENPVLSARLMRDVVGKNINAGLVHLAALAFGTFGAISLVLAVVGVYGVKACAVARRTREIGIRLALGARRSDVLALVLRQGALQLAVGLGAGLALALLAGGFLAKMLYRVSPFDPLALLVAALCVAVATLAACLIPARRAAKVDPMVALRVE